MPFNIDKFMSEINRRFPNAVTRLQPLSREDRVTLVNRYYDNHPYQSHRTGFLGDQDKDYEPRISR